MWYIVLFFILAILAVFYYYLFKKDVLSVSFISCIIYALSDLAAYISFSLKDSWNYVDLEPTVVVYILIAMVSVGIGEFIIRQFYKGKNKSESNNNIDYIKVSNLKIIICTLFIILTFFLVYSNMKSITGASGIGNVINSYKISSAMYNDGSDVKQINFIFTQMYRFAVAIGIIFLYIFVNNMCYNYKLKSNIKLFIPVAISIILAMLLGGRSSILKFVVAAFMFYMIIYSRKKEIKILEFARKGIIILVIILPIFYLLLGAIGQSTQNSFVNYMTFYMGSPIPGYNEYLSMNNNASNNYINHFGEHTFIGIQQILQKLKIIDYYNIYQNEWIDFGNGLKSNVFTGVKSYVQDFGVIGLIAFQVIFGIVFSFLYFKAKNSNYKYLIFYGMNGLLLIDQFRSEKVFSSLVRIDTFVYIIAIFVITWFLFNFKIEGDEFVNGGNESIPKDRKNKFR